MITQQECDSIKRAVRRLVRAEVDNAFRGAQDPIYWEDMDKELRSAKASISNLLSVKTQKPAKVKDGDTVKCVA